MKTAAFLLCLLFCLPALAGRNEDRKTCVQHFKDRKMDKAMTCFKRLIARGDAEKDPELYRLLGAACAIAKKREEAYKNYKIYVAKCPKCMFTPSVKKVVKQYESVHGKPADSAPTSPIGIKRIAKAKALLDKAEALKKRNPGQAREMMEAAARLLPKGHPLWKKVHALRDEMYTGHKR